MEKYPSHITVNLQEVINVFIWLELFNKTHEAALRFVCVNWSCSGSDSCSSIDGSLARTCKIEHMGTESVSAVCKVSAPAEVVLLVSEVNFKRLLLQFYMTLK